MDLMGARQGRPTLSAGISLHEFILRTCFGELGGQPGKLRQNFINEAHFRSKLVLVDVEG